MTIHARGGRYGSLVLPERILKQMGLGIRRRVRILYNPDFREWVIRPLKEHGTRNARSLH